MSWLKAGGHAVRRLLRWLLIAPIRLYQRFISPLLGPRCKYYPSCSAYAVTAIERHGAIRGFGLAVWRLLRCNPWSDGGVDDVPEPRSPKDSHNPATVSCDHL